MSFCTCVYFLLDDDTNNNNIIFIYIYIYVKYLCEVLRSTYFTIHCRGGSGDHDDDDDDDNYYFKWSRQRCTHKHTHRDEQHDDEE